MKRALLTLLTLALLAGCTTAPSVYHPGKADQLLALANKARAEATPQDLRDLAWGQWFYSKGEGHEVTGDSDPLLLVAQALGATDHGLDELAFNRWLILMEGHPPEALLEMAIHEISSLEELVPGYHGRLEPMVRRLWERPGGSAEVRALSGSLFLDLLRRRGAEEEALRVEASLGAPGQWAVAGPLGTYPLVDMDRPLEPEQATPLARTIATPRGPVTFRRVSFPRGRVTIEPDYPHAGTSYAVTTVRTDHQGPVLLRFRSSSSAQVFLDGQRVLRRDAFHQSQPGLISRSLDLTPGWHSLVVKLSSLHTRPRFWLFLTDLRGRPVIREANPPVEAPQGAPPPHAFTLPGPWPLSPPLQGPSTVHSREAMTPLESYARQLLSKDPDHLLGRFLLASSFLYRDDAQSALPLLQRLVDHAPSPGLLTRLGQALLDSDEAPEEVKQDQARQAFVRAVDLDPGQTGALYELAMLDLAIEQYEQALGRLEKGREAAPQSPLWAMGRCRVFEVREWDAEALQEAKVALKINPQACDPLLTLYFDALSRGDASSHKLYRERARACLHQDTTLAEELRKQGRLKEAIEDYQRLARRRPWDPGLRLDLARAYLSQGEADRARLQVEEHLALKPRSVEGWGLRADIEQSLGRGEGARAIMERGLSMAPSEFFLRQGLAHLQDREILGELKLDGQDIIRSFEAAAFSPQAGAVLVLDHTTIRILPDGSSLSRVHNIVRVLSKEAIDAWGEVTIPESARVYELRTIKADGRILEPEDIPQKENISMPGLEVGDYVEYDYLESQPPSRLLPGGYLSPWFFFRSYDLPLFHSQLTVLAPHGMELVVEGRGGAPQAEVTREEEGVLHQWVAKRQPQMHQEDRSVDALEFFPVVRVGVGATWDKVAESRYALLESPQRPSIKIEQWAQEARRGDPSQGEVVRRIFRRVCRDIRGDSAALGDRAADVVARSSGSRVSVLISLLRLLNIPYEAVFLRPFETDPTEAPLASGQVFTYPVLRVGLGDQAVWLDPNHKFSPHNYLPPTLQAVRGLVAQPGQARFITTPSYPGRDRKDLAMRINLDPQGNAQAEVEESLGGWMAVYLRSQLEDLDQSERLRRVETDINRTFPGAALGEFEVVNQDDPDKPLSLRYTFHVPSWAKAQGEAWIVEQGLWPTSLGKMFVDQPTRRNPLVVSSPIDSHLNVRVDYPSALAPQGLPWSKEVDGPFGRMNLTVQEQEGEVVLDRKLTLSMNRVRPEQYPDFAQFCLGVDKLTRKPLRFEAGR